MTESSAALRALVEAEDYLRRLRAVLEAEEQERAADDRVEPLARAIAEAVAVQMADGDYEPEPRDWQELHIEEERDGYREIARRVLATWNSPASLA